MEAEHRGVYFGVIDNEVRTKNIEIIQQADDADQVLAAAKRLFDDTHFGLTADRVLEEFSDDTLAVDLAEHPHFDRTLFKGVALFELANVDERTKGHIADYIGRLATYWRGEGEVEQGRPLVWLTAEALRAHPKPFMSLSEHVIRLMMMQRHEATREQIMQKIAETKQENVEDDLPPAAEDIESKKHFSIVVGDQVLEVPDDSSEVLNTQLRIDLTKQFPGPIIRELDVRFPTDGGYQDIIPLIEKIMEERRTGYIPPAEELISGYERQRSRPSMFGIEYPDETYEEKLRAARAQIEWMRDRRKSPIPMEFFHEESETWYMIVQLECDLAVNTWLRRAYKGDDSSKRLEELDPDEAEAVIAAYDEYHDRSPQFGPPENIERRRASQPQFLFVHGSWRHPLVTGMESPRD